MLKNYQRETELFEFSQECFSLLEAYWTSQIYCTLATEKERLTSSFQDWFVKLKSRHQNFVLG